MSDDEYDASGEEPEQRKQEGMDSVANNNSAWLEHAIWLADLLLPHGYVMGDQMQLLPGIGKPTRPEAWGPLTSQLVRRHILKETNIYRKSTRLSNNGHKYQVYWREGYPKEGLKDALAPDPNHPSPTGHNGVAAIPDGNTDGLPLFGFHNKDG